MERLTEKTKGKTERQYKAINNCYSNSPSGCANKLGKLEDIEDRINFPLEKAFECLEKGVYKFGWTRNIEHCDIRGIEINGLSAINKLCSSAECDELLKYEEYGKTWALTKEELEND